MKRNLLLIIVISACVSAVAQKKPAVSNPNYRAPRSRKDSLLNLDIREKLVQLAMQNPTIEIDDRNVAIAQYNLKRAKSNFLNNVVLSGNLNEYSIQTINSSQIYGNLFPRYNIGANLPLGLFVTRAKDVKIAR
jgi:outer membrane protein TolC